MIKANGYGHLTNRIPNNFFTRWLIKKANANMKKAGSLWRLRIRYRKPKPNCKYGWGGSLRCKDAKRIAIYAVSRYTVNK